MAIRVDGKLEYAFTHGHMPRGTGAWLFQIAGEVKMFRGTFTEAQKKALAYARKNHPRVFSIKVLP